jgi:hypothetical protein
LRPGDKGAQRADWAADADAAHLPRRGATVARVLTQQYRDDGAQHAHGDRLEAWAEPFWILSIKSILKFRRFANKRY